MTHPSRRNVLKGLGAVVAGAALGPQIVSAEPVADRFIVNTAAANPNAFRRNASLRVVHDGTYLAVHPLVVRGYTLTADVPSAANVEESVSITVDSQRQQGPTAEYTEVVITNNEETKRKQLQQTEGNRTVTVGLSTLSAGEYDVYVTARGGTDAYGEDEFLGITTKQSLELTRATPTPTPTLTTTPTPSPSPSPTDQPNVGSSGSATQSPTATSSSSSPTTTGASATPTQTSTTSTQTPTVSPNATATADTTPSQTTVAGDTPSVTASSTARDVVTPNDTTPTPQVGQPGFGAGAMAGAVLAVTLIYRRRDI